MPPQTKDKKLRPKRPGPHISSAIYPMGIHGLPTEMIMNHFSQAFPDHAARRDSKA